MVLWNPTSGGGCPPCFVLLFSFLSESLKLEELLRILAWFDPHCREYMEKRSQFSYDDSCMFCQYIYQVCVLELQ
jgi:hypothetical protein